MNRSSRMIKLTAGLLCALAIIFTACKKQEIQGPKGDPGTPGIGGNTNIVSTNTFIVNTASWVSDTVAQCMKITLNFPELTQNVVDKGSVKVYRQIGTVWTELPTTTTDLFMQFGFELGKLYLNYLNIEGGMPGTPPATERYRMVITSEAQRTAFPQVNNENYVQVGNIRAIVK